VACRFVENFCTPGLEIELVNLKVASCKGSELKKNGLFYIMCFILCFVFSD
jgi:hypothetical protein